MKADFDIAICGLGMSGLSLAANMAEGIRDNLSAVLFDPRTHYSDDRSWCHWNTVRHKFEGAISHTWPKWKVCFEGQEIVHSSDLYNYVHIDSGKFYKDALDVIHHTEGFDLRLGQTVEHLVDDGKITRVITSEGELTAAKAFDSRPSGPSKGTLLQHFLGWEIITKEEVFDPNTVVLMDFSAPSKKGVHFFYLLPFSPTQALVESTHLSADRYETERYRSEICSYLKGRYSLSAWDVVREEKGVIPMHRQSVVGQPSPRITRIGIAGGNSKASTGYCFAATQVYVEKLAAGLNANASLSGIVPRSRLGSWFDSVFVRFIEASPERLPQTLFDLFRFNDPETLVRFLSDQPKLSDYARVARSLPGKLRISTEALEHTYATITG